MGTKYALNLIKILMAEIDTAFLIWFKTSNLYSSWRNVNLRCFGRYFVAVTFHLLMLRPNTKVLISWMFLVLFYRTLSVHLQDISEGLPQDVCQICHLALHIGPYRDKLRTSAGNIFRLSAEDAPWCYL